MKTLKESLLDNEQQMINDETAINSLFNIKVDKWHKDTYIYAGIDLSDLKAQNRSQLAGYPVGGLGFKIIPDLDLENMRHGPEKFFSIDLIFISKKFANSDKVSDNYGGGNERFSLISYDAFRNNPVFTNIASMPLPKLKKYLIDRLKYIIGNIDKYKKLLGDIYLNADKNTWGMAEDIKIKLLVD